ncbi:MAG: transporter substrate-binding domain-containing protein [Synergistaceae bacterium]|nr:transporter substrate-binding domain-containing protein [Synergistaceae bacterium]
MLVKDPSSGKKRLILLSVSILVCLVFSSVCGAAERKVRVGYFSLPGYHEQDKDGRRSGYGYEYLQEMAKFADWTYEYVPCTWSDAQRLLKAGEIDLLTSAHKTPAREKDFDFSSLSIGSSNVMLTVKADNHNIDVHNFKTLRLKVGLLEGSTRNEEFFAFARGCGLTYDPAYFNSTEALLAGLKSGAVDAAVTSNLRVLKGERTIAEFAPSPYYVIVRKGDKALLDEVNKVLETINMDNPLFSRVLYHKYYGADNGGYFYLTDEEKAYVEKKKTINVAMITNKFPISGFKDGEAVGILPDFVRYFAKRAGLEVNFIGANGVEQSIELLKSGSADMLCDAHSDYYTAEQLGLRLTDPYFKSTYSMIAKKNANMDITNARVAAFKGSAAAYEYIDDNIPAANVTYYDTRPECLAAVRSGAQDVYFCDTHIANWLLREDMSSGLNSVLLPGVTRNYSIAIRREEGTTLFSIIDKCVKTMDDKTSNEIITKNTTQLNTTPSFGYYLYTSPSVAVGFFALIFAAFAGFALYVMSKRERTVQARLINEVMAFGTAMNSAYDEISELDFYNGVRYDISYKNGNMTRESVKWSLEEDAELFRDSLHPEDSEKLKDRKTKEYYISLIENKATDYYECRLRGKDGKYRWKSYMFQGMASDPIHKSSIMMFVKDINEAKEEEDRARAQLKEALERAQAGAQARSAFLSRMSHEIRTPLNVITGFMTIARQSLDNREKVKDCIEKTEVSSHHLLTIINDILDMSAIESGKIKIAAEDFDFKKFISTMGAMFYSQARMKGVNFDVSMKDVTEEFLVGDEGRLSQVLTNLLSNAIKFTPKDGTVTLRVTQMSRSENDRKVFMRFAVEDTGKGIKKEFTERLFMPFEQEDAGTSRLYGGSGLGLSITKNFVELMRGAITVESEEGKGSKFIVDMPFGLSSKKAEVSPQIARFADARVLIVDDDKDYCEYVTMLLDNYKVKSEYVLGGQEAVRKVEETYQAGERYDLFIVDLMMPDMNGLETINAIRGSIPEYTPVIIATAYDYSDIEDEARGAGVTAFVSKPLFQSTIFNILMDMYGRCDGVEMNEEEIGYDFSGKHVLLAEDNELNMVIASEILNGKGFIIDKAYNGREAFDMFMASRPGYYDVILMDIQMPVMDGYEATKLIRSSRHEDARSVPIIAMTANAFAEDVSRSLAAGMDNHIAKPIDVNALFSLLGHYLCRDKDFE